MSAFVFRLLPGALTKSAKLPTDDPFLVCPDLAPPACGTELLRAWPFADNGIVADVGVLLAVPHKKLHPQVLVAL